MGRPRITPRRKIKAGRATVEFATTPADDFVATLTEVSFKAEDWYRHYRARILQLVFLGH